MKHLEGQAVRISGQARLRRPVSIQLDLRYVLMRF